MMRILQVVARLLWVLCALALLITTLWLCDEAANRDMDIVLLYGMHLLAFPVGLVVGIVLGGVLALIDWAGGAHYLTSHVSIVSTWLSFFVVGYWQWFKAVPWIHGKTKSWLSERRKRAES